MITLGLVVPVYSGEKYLEKLVDAVRAERERFHASDAPISLVELVFVDDAAIDGSPGLLDRLAAQHDWVKVLHLSRNFGQHPATVAGILNCDADWIVTLDEDLQHPPDRVEELLRTAIATSSDVVYGRPRHRVHGGVFRDFASRSYKSLIERLTGTTRIRRASSFRLLRGDIARAVGNVCGHDTYFDMALTWFSTRIEAVEMDLKDKRHITDGSSGYSLRRLASHARRLAISSQIRLLRVGTLIGIVFFLLSIVGALVLLLLRLFVSSAIAVQGWTSLALLICLLGGMTMMLLGIVIEYISILVLRAHGKPRYFIIDRSSDLELAAYFALATERAALCQGTS